MPLNDFVNLGIQAIPGSTGSSGQIDGHDAGVRVGAGVMDGAWEPAGNATNENNRRSRRLQPRGRRQICAAGVLACTLPASTLALQRWAALDAVAMPKAR